VFDEFPKYQTKISLESLNAKVRKEDIIKSTIGNENLQEMSNDKGVRVVN
jgi:hypothetical protein